MTGSGSAAHPSNVMFPSKAGTRGAEGNDAGSTPLMSLVGSRMRKNSKPPPPSRSGMSHTVTQQRQTNVASWVERRAMMNEKRAVAASRNGLRGGGRSMVYTGNNRRWQ